MGQVCAKHNEYYEKRCRWCEEPEVSQVIIGAEEWNARIAEAAATPRAVPIIISPIGPTNLSTYQYWNPTICTIWKPHAAGYCRPQCAGIPGRTDWMTPPPGGVTGSAT